MKINGGGSWQESELEKDDDISFSCGCKRCQGRSPQSKREEVE